MRRLIFPVLLLLTFSACKKDKDEVTCEVSVAGIAGSYKVTKIVVSVSGVPDTDVTGSFMSACNLGGVYQLKADKKVVYTESASCSNDDTGNWDIVSNKMVIDFAATAGVDLDGTTVASWDCNTLVLTENAGSGTFRYTLTKQ